MMFHKIFVALICTGFVSFTVMADDAKPVEKAEKKAKICEKTGKPCTGDMKKDHDSKKEAGKKGHDCKKEAGKAHDCKKEAGKKGHDCKKEAGKAHDCKKGQKENSKPAAPVKK